jgi:hypothetical protein
MQDQTGRVVAPAKRHGATSPRMLRSWQCLAWPECFCMEFIVSEIFRDASS